MSEYTHTSIGAGYNSASDLNRELTKVESSIATKLDSDGGFLTGSIDFNSKDILNCNALDVESISLNGVLVTTSGVVTTTLPSQTTHSGKVLTTNGSVASWTDSFTVSSLVATTADINAGTVDATIGGTTPAAGTFTTLIGTNVDGIIGDNTPAAITGTTLTNTGLRTHSGTAGITADVGSAQGGSPLTTDINEISTCANIGDSVTLPTATAFLRITIINNGANAADVFPASSDNLGAGVDTAVSLAAGANITYASYDATNWESI